MPGSTRLVLPALAAMFMHGNTFSYRWDGEQWLITHHHSSLQPESVGH